MDRTSDFVKVARLADLPPGERLIFRVEDESEQVALFNIEGQLYCIADVCTHDDGPVAEGEVDGFSIECPRHGARFDIRDGHVLRFPAITPIDTYDVEVDGEDVYVRRTPRS